MQAQRCAWGTHAGLPQAHVPSHATAYVRRRPRHVHATSCALSGARRLHAAVWAARGAGPQHAPCTCTRACPARPHRQHAHACEHACKRRACSRCAHPPKPHPLWALPGTSSSSRHRSWNSHDTPSALAVARLNSPTTASSTSSATRSRAAAAAAAAPPVGSACSGCCGCASASTSWRARGRGREGAGWGWASAPSFSERSRKRRRSEGCSHVGAAARTHARRQARAGHVAAAGRLRSPPPALAGSHVEEGGARALAHLAPAALQHERERARERCAHDAERGLARMVAHVRQHVGAQCGALLGRRRAPLAHRRLAQRARRVEARFGGRGTLQDILARGRGRRAAAELQQHLLRALVGRGVLRGRGAGQGCGPQHSCAARCALRGCAAASVFCPCGWPTAQPRLLTLNSSHACSTATSTCCRCCSMAARRCAPLRTARRAACRALPRAVRPVAPSAARRSVLQHSHAIHTHHVIRSMQSVETSRGCRRGRRDLSVVYTNVPWWL